MLKTPIRSSLCEVPRVQIAVIHTTTSPFMHRRSYRQGRDNWTGIIRTGNKGRKDLHIRALFTFENDLKKDSFIFKEKGRKGENHGCVTSISCLSHPATGDLVRIPGMCPGQESNLSHTPSTEPHQPGLKMTFKKKLLKKQHCLLSYNFVEILYNFLCFDISN